MLSANRVLPLALLVAILGAACSPAHAPTPAPTPVPTLRISPPLEPKESVTLTFGGDVHFEGNAGKMLSSFDEVLTEVSPTLAKADFSMVNLESAVTEGGVRDPKELEAEDQRYHFRTDTRALNLLKHLGVDAVSMANNHAADYGDAGLQDTLQARADNFIPMVGVGKNRADAFAPHYVDLKGTSFAFMAADASKLESNGANWNAGPNNPGLASAHNGKSEALLEAVATAAEKASVVVVYMHWGDENVADVSPGQKRLAKQLSSAGASIVVGSHVHKPQASGWLNEKTYVAYGLGNFIWYHGQAPQSGMLTLTVKDGKVASESWTPITIPLEGGETVLAKDPARAAQLALWKTLKKQGELMASPPKPNASRTPFSATIDGLTAKSPELKGSWRKGCPVPPSRLSLLTFPHYGFDGEEHEGKLIVASKVAHDVVDVFRKLHDAKYPIERMKPVSAYGGNDDRSMAANNSSGFNCRNVANTARWSNHSYGEAIDINPVQNPYVLPNEVLPPSGAEFRDVDRTQPSRASRAQGVVATGDVAVKAFEAIGWEWGGVWAATPDYQHFSSEG